MTDTTIRVNKETRQRLGSWAELRNLTQGEAIDELLDRVDAQEVPDEWEYVCNSCGHAEYTEGPLEHDHELGDIMDCPECGKERFQAKDRVP